MLCVRYLARPGQILISRSNPFNATRNVWASSGFRQQQQQASSSNPQQKIYELRIYTIKPLNFREFLNLTAEEFHLRLTHSKLLGYWTCEIGGLNQVVHIWEYDSLSHRAKVRENLASDPEWNSRYLSRVAGMFQEMNNSLFTLLPGTEINAPTGKGVYELHTLNFNGAPVTWSHSLLRYVKACKDIEMGATKLVGAWQSVIGPRQSAALLWQHPGPDSCVPLHLATNSLEENEAMSAHVSEGHKRYLLPHKVSPWQ